KRSESAASDRDALSTCCRWGACCVAVTYLSMPRLVGKAGSSSGVCYAALGWFVGSGGSVWCVWIRASRSVRSVAVNVQLNGLAVVLYRLMKASRVAVSSLVSAKSLGETTFFWMIEKKISAWLSQDAWTGVWIKTVFGYLRVRRSAAALPRWSDPLSTTKNTRLALA